MNEYDCYVDIIKSILKYDTLIPIFLSKCVMNIILIETLKI